MNPSEAIRRARSIGEEYGKIKDANGCSDFYINIDSKGLRDACEYRLKQLGMDTMPFAVFSLRVSLPERRIYSNS